MRRLLIVLAAGAFATSCGSSAVAPTPTPSVTQQPAPSASASARPLALDHEVVYFARDRLPPVAAHVAGAGAGATPEARVLSRLEALFVAVAPSGLFNVAARAKARPASVRIEGDVATVDFSVPGDWGTAGSTGIRAFVQQLVYTASEEPGIRRVFIEENGGQAIIGGEGLVIDHAAAREDVAGYTFAASRDVVALGSEPRAVPLAVTATLSPDSMRSLSRLVITADALGAEAKVPLAFRATVTPNDEQAAPLLGKWVLSVEVPYATTSVADTMVFDKTPVRSMRTQTIGTTVRYDIGLDDLRPWRVSMRYAPLRLVVDIGGDPDATSPNIALYTPAFGATVRSGYAIAGMLRAFEARFEYRVRDASGEVVVDDFATASLGTSDLWGTFSLSLPTLPPGAASVEILLRSPRDGEISESVSASFDVVP